MKGVTPNPHAGSLGSGFSTTLWGGGVKGGWGSGSRSSTCHCGWGLWQDHAEVQGESLPWLPHQLPAPNVNTSRRKLSNSKQHTFLHSLAGLGIGSLRCCGRLPLAPVCGTPGRLSGGSFSATGWDEEQGLVPQPLGRRCSRDQAPWPWGVLSPAPLLCCCCWSQGSWPLACSFSSK